MHSLFEQYIKRRENLKSGSVREFIAAYGRRWL